MKILLAVGQSNNDTNRHDAAYVANQGVSYTGYDVQIWNPFAGAWQTLADAAGYNDPTWPGSTPRPFFTAAAAVSLACRISQENSEQVRVICPNWPGAPIANWVPATASNYVSDKAMVEAALTEAGAAAVDVVTFLQGESDWTRPASAYRSDHENWQAQLRAETWCEAETPFVLFGLVWGGNTEVHNDTLGLIAAQTPRVGYAPSLDLPSDDLLQHYTPDGLWRLGYDRAWAAYQDALTANSNGPGQFPFGGAANVFRDLSNPATPSEGMHDPDKGEIRDLLGNYEDKLDLAWRADNDGHGTGLDADLLDGKHATDFEAKDPGLGRTLKMGPNTTLELDGAAVALQQIQASSGSTELMKFKDHTGALKSGVLNGGWMFVPTSASVPGGASVRLVFAVSNGSGGYDLVAVDGTKF